MYNIDLSEWVRIIYQSYFSLYFFFKLGALTMSADMYTISGNPSTTTNFGMTGEHIFEVGVEKS